jgi:hypothetical protein
MMAERRGLQALVRRLQRSPLERTMRLRRPANP